MHGPRILFAPGKVTLRWELESAPGKYEWVTAEFTGVEAVQVTGHDSCAPEQVQARDRLLMIEPSEMLSRLRPRRRDGLHHFRIYFDQLACLDVAAEQFIPPRF